MESCQEKSTTIHIRQLLHQKEGNCWNWNHGYEERRSQGWYQCRSWSYGSIYQQTIDELVDLTIKCWGSQRRERSLSWTWTVHRWTWTIYRWKSFKKSVYWKIPVFSLLFRINYQAWLVQLLIWVSIVVIGKGVLFGFEYGLKNPLKNFSVLIMGWIENYPVLELFVVLIFVPVVMNALAFWVQDNFLMKKEEVKVEGENPLIEEQTTTQR